MLNVSKLIMLLVFNGIFLKNKNRMDKIIHSVQIFDKLQSLTEYIDLNLYYEECHLIAFQHRLYQ